MKYDYELYFKSKGFFFFSKFFLCKMVENSTPKKITAHQRVLIIKS